MHGDGEAIVVARLGGSIIYRFVNGGLLYFSGLWYEVVLLGLELP